jgi:hypothetical protein
LSNRRLTLPQGNDGDAGFMCGLCLLQPQHRPRGADLRQGRST